MIVHVVAIVAEANHELASGIIDVFTDEQRAFDKCDAIFEKFQERHPNGNFAVTVSPVEVDVERDIDWPEVIR